MSPTKTAAAGAAAARRSPFYAPKTIDDFAGGAGGAAGSNRDVPSICLFYKSTRAFLTYLREAMEQVKSAYDQNYLPEENESQLYYSRTVDQYLMKEPYPDTNERHEYKVVIEISSYAGHYNIFLKRYFRIHSDTAATAAKASTTLEGGVDENDGRVLNVIGAGTSSGSNYGEWKPTKAYYLFSRHDNVEDIESFVVESMKRENARLFARPRKV